MKYILIVIFLSICTALLFGYNTYSNAKKSNQINVIGSKIRNGVMYNTDGTSKKVDRGGKILEGSISEFLSQEHSQPKE